MDRREEVCRGRSIATPKKKEGDVGAGAGLGGQGGGGLSRAGGKKVKIRRGGRRVEFIRGYLIHPPRGIPAVYLYCMVYGVFMHKRQDQSLMVCVA